MQIKLVTNVAVLQGEIQAAHVIYHMLHHVRYPSIPGLGQELEH